ncbi:hypothetical protein FE257_005943 [Aspergillus nanangensis]|uniref:Uncharacterized protein n=1 Tax=Aspergillus nanangensis TaxID=2582783 RepID=A0AAD4CRM6_ASPNN|nr:hypothetical protein FE257_005943 [Aspergillus nanangensis]
MPRPTPKTGPAAHQAVQSGLERYREFMRNKSFEGTEKILVESLELVGVEPDNTVIFSLFLGPQFQHVGSAKPNYPL